MGQKAVIQKWEREAEKKEKRRRAWLKEGRGRMRNHDGEEMKSTG